MLRAWTLEPKQEWAWSALGGSGPLHGKVLGIVISEEASHPGWKLYAEMVDGEQREITDPAEVPDYLRACGWRPAGDG